MSGITSDDHVRRVGRGSSMNLAGAVAAAILGILVSIAIGRSLTKADAGIYFASTALVLIAASVARLGTPVGLVYWIARLRTLDRNDQLGSVLKVALAPVVGLSVLLSVLVLVTAPWLSDHLLGGSGTATSLVRVLAVFLPFVVLSDVLLGATRGFGTMRPTALIDRMSRPSLQLVLILAAASLAGLVAVGAGWALPYVITSIVAAIWLSQLIKNAPQPTNPSPDDEPMELRRAFWTFTWPRSVTSIIQQALQRLDIILVSALRSPAEAALYGFATRFLVVGQLANSALGLAAQPQIARLITDGRREEANAVYRSTTTWVILMNGPLYLVVAAFSPLLLSLFGQEYVEAWPVTVAICVAAFLGNGAGMVDVMLSMAGRTTWTLANSLVALFVQVIVDVSLIPGLGAFGAALGWGASILTANTLSLIQLHRADGLHPFERATGTAAGFALVGVGIPTLLAIVILGQTWLALILSLAVAVPAYCAMLWRARESLHIELLLASLRRQPAAKD
ncbi:MAG TPA: oligosaccharide flippase family protein [Actinomycetes bacterium]|nr:oligosaccharide flippase family protein [Actinomycetes bacterium]